MTKRARQDTNYQMQTVLVYIADLLEHGWTPERGGELEIIIQNPTGEAAENRGGNSGKFRTRFRQITKHLSKQNL